MYLGIPRTPVTTAMIALALGYIVAILAHKEKGKLQPLGYLIGAAIILASTLLILAKLAFITTNFSSRCNVSMHRKMMMQEQQPLKVMPPAPVPKK